MRARLLLVVIASLACASAAIAHAIAQDAGRRDAGPRDAGPRDGAAPLDGARDAAPESDGGGLPPGVGPITWAPGLGRDCHRYGKRQVCEGPRRVPLASEEALARQRALGLDQHRIAHRATSGPIPPEWAAAAPEGDPDDGLLWPVQGGRLWRGFGIHHRLQRTKSGQLRQLRSSRRHEGIDIGAHRGTPILAADDALVVYSDNGMSGYGNALLLAHRDGTVTLYGHCQETYVAAGEIVRRGQIIAAVGDTGLAHGAHLHFEYRIAGHVVDPRRRMRGRPGAPDPELPPPPVEEPEEPSIEPPDAEPEPVVDPAIAEEHGHDEPAPGAGP